MGVFNLVDNLTQNVPLPEPRVDRSTVKVDRRSTGGRQSTAGRQCHCQPLSTTVNLKVTRDHVPPLSTTVNHEVDRSTEVDSAHRSTGSTGRQGHDGRQGRQQGLKLTPSLCAFTHRECKVQGCQDIVPQANHMTRATSFTSSPFSKQAKSEMTC